jgi:hypothetical protein
VVFHHRSHLAIELLDVKRFVVYYLDIEIFEAERERKTP